MNLYPVTGYGKDWFIDLRATYSTFFGLLGIPINNKTDDTAAKDNIVCGHLVNV